MSQPRSVPPRIVSAQIGDVPRTLGDQMPEVVATFNNGARKTLFSYYPDEIAFTEAEFIGLTESEAHALKFRKDRQYLRA